MSVLPIGINATVALDAGQTFLATCDGWWDAPTYAGSGNLLNLGTAGSTGDLVVKGTSADPTFASGKFTFDGVDDYLANAASVSAFNAPARNGTAVPFTVGIVLTFPTTLSSFSPFISKRNANAGISEGFWYIVANGTTKEGYCTVGANDGSGIAATLTGASSAGTKALLMSQIMPSPATNFIAFLNSSQGGSNADGRTNGRDCSTTAKFTIGGYNGADAAFSANHEAFDLHAAFVRQGSTSAQNILDIRAHYGI